ncbi:MAG: tetratricopeptide repeat protein [Candidatus Coatesbacteria bacterium]|nr:tetratricopeptide repeat protein [Candidatus Coatesbacteria bacterium]
MFRYLFIILIFVSLTSAAVTEKTLFGFAKQLIITGQYELAEAQLEELLETYPNSPNLIEYYLLLFQVDEKLGYNDKINNLSEAFVRKYPNHPKTPTLLIGVVERKISNGSFNEAESILSRLEAKYQDTPAGQIAKLYKIRIALSKEGPGIAKTMLDNLSQDLRKQYVNEIAILKSRIHIAERNYKEAYEALIGLYKGMKPELKIEAGTLIADCLIGQKKNDEAEILLNNLLKEFPQNLQQAQINLSLGLIQSASGNYPRALETYRSFLKNNPYHPLANRARLEAGKAALSLGNYALAIRYLEEFQSLGRNSEYSEEGHYYLIKALYSTGREEVKMEIENFLALYPNSRYKSEVSSYNLKDKGEIGSLEPSFNLSKIEPLLRKAINLKESKRYDDAISYLNQLIIMPVNPLADWVVFELAENYRLKGDYTKSESHYKRIIEEMSASRFYPLAKSRLLYKNTEGDIRGLLDNLLLVAAKGNRYVISDAIDRDIIDFRKAASEISGRKKDSDKANYHLLAALLNEKAYYYAICYDENSSKYRNDAVENAEEVMNLKTGGDFEFSAAITLISLKETDDFTSLLNMIDDLLKQNPKEPYLADLSLMKASLLLKNWGKTSPDAIISLTEAYQKDKQYQTEAFFLLGQYWNKYGEYNIAAKNLYNAVNSPYSSPYKSDAYFVLGETYFKLGQLSESAGIYERYIIEFPFGKDLLSSKSRLADIYIKLGKIQRGLAIYQNLLTIHKSKKMHGELLYQYANALELAGRTKDAYEKYQEALKDVDNSDKKTQAKILGSLIQIAIKLGHSQETLDYLKKLKPKSSEIYYNRTIGKLNFENEKYEEALSYFIKNKDDPESVAYQAICNLRLNRITKARRIIKFYRKYYPNDEDYYALIRYEEGLLEVKGKRIKSAKMVFSSLIKDNNTPTATKQWSMLHLGVLSRFEKDEETATYNFSKVMKEGVTDSLRIEAGFNLADLYIDNEKLAEAKLIYNQLLNQSKTQEHRKAILANLGLLSQQLSAWDEAIRYLQESLSLEKKNEAKAELLMQIGYCYHNQGQLNSALHFFKKAENMSSNPEVQKNILIHRGGAYQQVKDYNKAVLNFMKVIRFFEDRDETYYAAHIMIGECYQATGDIEKAKDYYMKAKEQKKYKDISKDADDHLKRLETQSSSPVNMEDPTKPSPEKKERRKRRR